MVRLTGPLFSEKAQKQLGKNLIYKRKGSRSLLTKYNKPGGANPFDPSPTQVNQRMIYNLIIANWQVKSTAQKKVFDDLAKSKNLKMSGWNYFVREAVADLPTYLGLQGYWAFNRIVAGQYQDISGNENHGTPKPLYPSNYPQMVDSINRKFGTAASFDGIDDYVHCGNDNSLDTPHRTYSAWIKCPTQEGGAPNIKTLISKHEHYQGGLYLVRDITPHRVNYQEWISGLRRTAQYDLPADNLWYFVVGTFNGEELKLYVNGVLETTTPRIGTIDSNNEPVRIGGGVANRYVVGFIDEARIYDRALSLEEIKKHYDLISK